MSKEVIIDICKSLARIENFIYIVVCCQYGEQEAKKAYKRISKIVDKQFEQMEGKNE